MLWRTYLLDRLVGPYDVRFVVGRHPIVYLKVLIKYIAIFAFLFLAWRVTSKWIPGETLQIPFGIITALAYAGGVYALLRDYFDIMVATDEHLCIIGRDSFFKYRIKTLPRSAIRDISVVPTSRLGVLRHDANIVFVLEADDIWEFAHVYHATSIVNKMYALREGHVQTSEMPPMGSQEQPVDDEKFKVLVETLGEVIVDYMKKKE